MSRYLIVDDIVEEIRSLTDEENTVQLESDSDILPSLNRAQAKAYQILSRVHQDPLKAYTEVAVTSKEYTLPENIWEDKLVRLEWFSSGRGIIHCDRVDLSLLATYDHYTRLIPAPQMFTVHGRVIRFNGTPDGSYTLRIWYLREVDDLLLSDARITNVDEAENKLYVSDVNPDFDPSGLTSFVNVVDGQTGLIKATLEIKSWNGSDTLVFRTIPSRTKVLNRTINTNLSGLGIEADDYICFARGTCVLQFFDAVHTFIVQYTTAEMKRKLGFAYDVDQKLAQDFEEDLRKTYQGRARNLRIASTNPNWITGGRRRYIRGTF